ncbi:MAG: hypothetical protein AB7E70_19550 [Hyphomicrobiaceae bacterium]
MSESKWEEFSAATRMWGVFDVEQPYEATPRAMFMNKADAESFIAWAKADATANPDDTYHNNAEHYQTLPVAGVSGFYFNSYDEPDWREAPERFHV